MRFMARNPSIGVARAMSRFKLHREVRATKDLFADAPEWAPGPTALVRRFHPIEHHPLLAQVLIFCSPFERATGLSIDGSGDFASSLLATCEGPQIKVHRRVLLPHSLGVFYTALCQFIGFDRFGEEYNVMGLSAYGVNRFAPEMKQIVRVDPVAGLELNLRFFRHHLLASTMDMTSDGESAIPQLWSDQLISLFGAPRRRKDALTERDHDLAASMQVRFEEVYLEMLAHAVDRTGIRDVALAGGSVLNSVGNGRMITERAVDRAYFHPAASDDGTAAGAALQVMFGVHAVPRAGALTHAYLGTEWDDAAIEAALHGSKLPVPQADARRAAGDGVGRALARQNRGLVPGARRVGPARAREPEHPLPPGLAGDEGDAQRAHQEQGAFPALRSRGADGPTASRAYPGEHQVVTPE